MRRLATLTMLVMTPFTLTACATMNVSSHVLKSADFEQYRTFDWGPADALPTADPRLDRHPFFQDHLQGALEKGFASKGFDRVSSGTPDLLVHYHANISRRIDINRLDSDRGYCYGDDCQVRTVEVEAGTLVVDVVDARTNRLVWRGWAQHSVQDMLNDRDTMERKINDAVTRMLEQLPGGAQLQSGAVRAHIGAH